MLPLQPFLNFIDQNKLFSASDNILLAVSGGRDSVLLALLFNEAKFRFGIAHCNFGLRAEESDSDEVFVRQLASRLNVPFYSTHFTTASFAEKNKVSTQMAARDLRYNWFEKVRAEEAYDYIALAHHASDVTETILLNLVRGTGISGLHGIKPKRGYLIRPLLFLTRQEIDEIVVKADIAYREDSSNLSSKYARNKIRLEVIPKLRELNPSIDETFQANSLRFTELEIFLENQTEEIRKTLFMQKGSGEIEISLSGLKSLRPRNLLLYNLFKPYGFTQTVLEDLAEAWDNGPGRIFESNSYRLLLDRNSLFLMPLETKSTEVHFIHSDEAALRLQESAIIYHLRDAKGLKISSNPNVATIAADKLQFPLKIRKWNKGDSFYPFGMNGRKKLSDFFISLKIPVHRKTGILLLENGNGDIIWVVGYRIDNRYKVSEQTKKVYIFEKHKLHGKQTHI